MTNAQHTFKKENLFDPSLLKASVYGANDGIITTFAVVAGVAGAHLSTNIIIILGIANMIADGLSMAVGDYLGEKSEVRLREQRKESITACCLWKTGVVTFFSFVAAGSLPLLPYFLRFMGFPIVESSQFLLSIIATAGALFFIGSLRTFVTKGSWIKNGLEMLGIGAIAAIAAYVLGAWIEQLIQ